MEKQRNPKVGDIVEYKMWDDRNSTQYKYLKVTNIIEYPDGSVVQMKYFLMKDKEKQLHTMIGEWFFAFDVDYKILENVTEQTIRVLYGS